MIFQMRARAEEVGYMTRARGADGEPQMVRRMAHFGEVFAVGAVEAAGLLATGGAVLAHISKEALEGERAAKLAAYRAARSGHAVA